MYCITDSIEANVENAQIKVEEGNKQLSKAVTYQVELSYRPRSNMLSFKFTTKFNTCMKLTFKNLHFKSPHN